MSQSEEYKQRELFKTIVEIMCSDRPGAGANAVREDYPEVAAIIDPLLEKLRDSEAQLKEASDELQDHVGCMAKLEAENTDLKAQLLELRNKSEAAIQTLVDAHCQEVELVNLGQIERLDLKERLELAKDALRTRVIYGHNDTCDERLFVAGYSCTCGHTKATEALEKLCRALQITLTSGEIIKPPPRTRREILDDLARKEYAEGLYELGLDEANGPQVEVVNAATSVAKQKAKPNKTGQL